MRTVDNIIGELKSVKDNLPFIKIILFNDDAFFLMPLETIKEFSSKYKKHIKMPLIITGATPSTLSKTKLSVLVEAGLIEMRMGIQTLAETSKKLYKRPHSNNAIMEAVSYLKNVDVKGGTKMRDTTITKYMNIILRNIVDAHPI